MGRRGAPQSVAVVPVSPPSGAGPPDPTGAKAWKSLGESKRGQAAPQPPPGIPAPPQASGKAGGEQPEQRSCLTSQLRKTKICVYHLKGACQYGSSCAFAHSCTELQSIPDLRKTRLCQAFELGQCNNKDCSFAHGEEELRSTDLFYKKTLCIWNQKGKCRNGKQCRFAHGEDELRPTGGGPAWAGSGGFGGGREPGQGRAAARKKEAKVVVEESPFSDAGDGSYYVPQKLEEPMKIPLGGHRGLSFSDATSSTGTPESTDLPPLPLNMPGPPALAGFGGNEAMDWWQWQAGYGLGTPMAPPVPQPVMSNNLAGSTSVEELKAHLARLRSSVQDTKLRADLERLTQQCHKVQQKLQEANLNTAAGMLAGGGGSNRVAAYVYAEAGGAAGEWPLQSDWA